jgi:Zn finger protein HypA/HybF involved in hydrogenase expression
MPLVVPKELMEKAVLAIESDRLRTPSRCTVCSEPCAPNSNEGLCWVCRRLKLSAWRDSDTQMPAQE